ncbi:MAG: GTP cyclohydrolase I FolE [Cyanobacteria bacterium SZAS LIN-5]|nr:GTP cyclohydrolase I FolE [Cyanobacteria bacterium SZAS LIN-5]RTL38385.1 MAG: GTP cyclohydrolase I FolE [Candidatus Melainabacteria bacterium]
METILPKANQLKPKGSSATRASAVGESTHAALKMDLEKIAEGVRLILEGVGEDPSRPELLETPARVARMYRELLYGTGIDAGAEITCTFNEENDDLVLVKDIPFSSVCEHHLVPFIGIAHVAYIPNQGKITGLSKLARVVELASRKLQVQERMTGQIADAIMRRLDPLGVIVVLEAEHFCMSIRGVRKAGTRTVTSAARGALQEDKSARAEVMAFIHNK